MISPVPEVINSPAVMTLATGRAGIHAHACLPPERLAETLSGNFSPVWPLLRHPSLTCVCHLETKRDHSQRRVAATVLELSVLFQQRPADALPDSPSSQLQPAPSSAAHSASWSVLNPSGSRVRHCCHPVLSSPGSNSSYGHVTTFTHLWTLCPPHGPISECLGTRFFSSPLPTSALCPRHPPGLCSCLLVHFQEASTLCLLARTHTWVKSPGIVPAAFPVQQTIPPSGQVMLLPDGIPPRASTSSAGSNSTCSSVSAHNVLRAMK